ncbi:MAG: ABC transporter ATP-binding protein [Acidimicrobiales bacterium]
MAPLLRVSEVVKRFPVGRGLLRTHAGEVHAVDGVSFEIDAGQTLGLVGESGCGKTTLARLVLRLLRPDSGSIELAGEDITAARGEHLRRLRRDMQMVFQDPFDSLNPRMSVRQIVSEPLIAQGLSGPLGGKQGAWREGGARRVADLLDRVGLDPGYVDRFPHQFSGGQRQRIGVARALAAGPKLIVCDEPVSALDVSMRAQVLNLLADVQAEFGLTYLFISHDLSVVREVCDRVAVMYLGRIVEQASREELFRRPLHPYTQALISAVPIPDPAVEARRRRIVLTGEVPSPLRPPPGCPFHTRCWKAKDRCLVDVPKLVDLGDGHFASCHFPEPVDLHFQDTGAQRT